MPKLQLIDSFYSCFEPIIKAMGYELWGIEMRVDGCNSILCIYINSEHGIKLDDCSKVSYQLGSVLDVENPIDNKYTLEVSSPGLDRALFTLEQCGCFVGHMVRIKVGKHKHVGKIEAVTNEHVIISNELKEFRITSQELKNMDYKLRIIGS